MHYNSIILVFVASQLLNSPSLSAEPMTYPETRRGSQTDNYHGTDVADPYRWLEADAHSDTDVQEWVAAQNEVTQQFLKSIPRRDKIETRLTELWNYEKYSSPYLKGGRYFYSKNDGLQNQSVVYTLKSLDDEPEVLLDPNSWSEDGTVALAGMAVSEDGKYVAYGVAESGSDWRTWRVMEIESRKVLEDKVEWVKFSAATWTKDSQGFFYSRYQPPEEDAEFQSLNLNQQVYYHRIGTDQSEDQLIYERPDEPEWGFSNEVTEDGRYHVLTVWKGTDAKYMVLVRDLQAADPNAKPQVVIEQFESDYSLIGSDGSLLYFRTDNEAPKGRVIAIDLAQPQRADWQEIIPEAEETLDGVSWIGGKLIVDYLKDARTLIRVHETDGTYLRDVDLPGIGTAGGFRGKQNQAETFYGFTSFATPTRIYRYDVATGKSQLFREAQVDFDPDRYTVTQVFYTSRDGTRVPMFIAHRKDLQLDGSNPALLYAYGGFNNSLTPYFSISRLTWMEMGGVFAMANLRGGGEYGEAWHEAGKREKKQNVFDDFHAAAEWLVENKYTRSDKLAIQGGSNGGLLVGACLVQRPELYGACLPAVGVMDMLRFHQFTAGRFWVDEYGSAEEAEMFPVLYKYSPYHNLKPGSKYPATLVTTADTDDRVVPGHSFKFAAAIQAAQSGDAPVLIRIETKAGHGAGKPTSKIIKEIADQWAFLTRVLDVPANRLE